MALVLKNPLANAGDIRDMGSIPGLGRSPGGDGHGNPLQYSYLENPIGRGAWRATVHEVANSLKRLSTHAGSESTMHSPTHSSVLAWRIPGTGEPAGGPSMGSHRVGHD